MRYMYFWDIKHESCESASEQVSGTGYIGIYQALVTAFTNEPIPTLNLPPTVIDLQILLPSQDCLNTILNKFVVGDEII